MSEEYQCIESGNISLLYYRGFFRKFSLRGNEFLRGIYPAIRDQDWGTVPCVHSETLQPASSSSDTLIRENLRFEQGPIKFLSEVCMFKMGENEWEFSFEGRAENSFYKNRIGWNLLLPVDSLKGRDFQIINEENMQMKGIFPHAISPCQPVKQIKKLSFTDARGIQVYIEFEGDIFEMEDQRNWTDASYKIYSTPLELPFPVKLAAGESIRQRIRVRIDEQKTGKARIPATNLKKGRFPLLGLGVDSGRCSYQTNEIEALLQLDIDFLSIHLKNNSKDDAERLRKHFRFCRQLGKKTVLSLALDKNEELHPGLLQEIQNNQSTLESLELFDRSTFLCAGDHIEKTLKCLKSEIPALKTGGGSFAYYAELNRADSLCDAVDYLGFSVSPQVHAFDDLSIIENLEGISSVLQDAKLKFGQAIHLNALTLKQRMNFVATGKDDPSEDHEQFLDKRQDSVFAALWLLGALKRCSLESCRAVSMFETPGKKGILHSEKVFPLYHMIREILRHRSAELADLELPSEMCDGLQLSEGKQTIYWIWNYGDRDMYWHGLESKQVEEFNFSSGRWDEVDHENRIKHKSLYQLIQ